MCPIYARYYRVGKGPTFRNADASAGEGMSVSHRLSPLLHRSYLTVKAIQKSANAPDVLPTREALASNAGVFAVLESLQMESRNISFW